MMLNWNINLIALLLCGVASMAIGFVWYGPLFGEVWIKLAGFSKKDIESSKKKGMGSTYGFAFLSSLTLAFVLFQFLTLSGATTLTDGVMIAIWAWVGFVATTHLVHKLFEQKSWTLYLVAVGYHLVEFISMGVILTLLG